MAGIALSDIYTYYLTYDHNRPTRPVYSDCRGNRGTGAGTRAQSHGGGVVVLKEVHRFLATLLFGGA